MMVWETLRSHTATLIMISQQAARARAAERLPCLPMARRDHHHHHHVSPCCRRGRPCAQCTPQAQRPRQSLALHMHQERRHEAARAGARQGALGAAIGLRRRVAAASRGHEHKSTQCQMTLHDHIGVMTDGNTPCVTAACSDTHTTHPLFWPENSNKRSNPG